MKKRKLYITIFVLCGLFSLFVYFRVDREAVLCEINYQFHHEQTYLEHGTQLYLDLEPLHKIDKDYGNWLVHPCVRYIEKGLNGHKWWMAVTPYPNANSRYEQPILFYGEGNDTIPPKNWRFVGLVQDWHPDGGYNADPNLFFDGTKLWIFWKECKTSNTDREHAYNCVMCKYFDGKKFGTPIRVLNNNDSINVRLTAPIVYEKEGKIKLIATEFEHPRDHENEALPFGNSHFAVWELRGAEFSRDAFSYQKKAIQNYKKGFDFWHADICQLNDFLYASVVTPGQANEILIGFSKNGENFNFLPKPLLSSKGNGISRMYKPSLVFVGKTAYLFYPARVGVVKGIESSSIFYTSFCISDVLDNSFLKTR